VGCIDPDGARTDWILFVGPAPLVLFNEGAALSLEVGFAAAASIFGGQEQITFAQRRNLEAVDMINLGDRLGAVVKVQGATLSDRGTYTLRIAPPVRLQ
jgi:hypothetical protein